MTPHAHTYMYKHTETDTPSHTSSLLSVAVQYSPERVWPVRLVAVVS